MIQKRTLELSVGLFVLLGAIALFALFFKVSGIEEMAFAGNSYKVTAQFSNIGNLKKNAKVVLAGVTIGRVSDVSLDRTNLMANVTMQINKEVDNLPSDSEARILTAGLLGDKFVGIKEGFAEDYLKEGSAIGLENTESALSLEDLIGKFFSSKTSGI